MPVVVGYIPTPEGRAALRRALIEARLRRTKIVVVNSQPDDRKYDREDVLSFEEELDRVRVALESEGLEHEVRGLARGNDPAEDLIEIAARENADFIVIGLRKRSPVGKLVLGSNAQQILLDATCPVLAVKADQV